MEQASLPVRLLFGTLQSICFREPLLAIPGSEWQQELGALPGSKNGMVDMVNIALGIPSSVFYLF
jgi:hypothetical protein